MGNPTEIKYYDVDGFAFTEQRTYARGGQLTGFTIPTTAADVTVNTAGSYSYDTNNNMTGTKKLDAYRTISGTNYKIAFRAQWTFSFDRKNRLRTHTYAGGSNVRGNICYDGMGRVWQRWNDNSSTGDWDADLKRFVYDGNAMAQDHEFVAMEVEGAWSYAYGQLNTDYLRKPDGIRQKVNNGVGGWDSHLLFNDGADVASRTPSGSSTTITRTLRTASGDRLNDNPRMTAGLTSGSFSNISNLAKPNSYIESYGGGTELGTSSLGYDSLVQSGPVHQLPGLGGMILNSPPTGGGPGGGGSTFGGGIPVGGGGGGLGVPGGSSPPPSKLAPIDPSLLEISGELAEESISIPWLRRDGKSWEEHVNDCCDEQWFKHVPEEDHCHFLKNPYDYCCSWVAGPCLAVVKIIECQDLLPYTCQDYLCGAGYDVEGGGARHCMCERMRQEGWDDISKVPPTDQGKYDMMVQFREDCGITAWTPWGGGHLPEEDECLEKARHIQPEWVSAYMDPCLPDPYGGHTRVWLLDPAVCCRLATVERLGAGYCAFVTAVFRELMGMVLSDECCYLVWSQIHEAISDRCAHWNLP